MGKPAKNKHTAQNNHEAHSLIRMIDCNSTANCTSILIIKKKHFSQQDSSVNSAEDNATYERSIKSLTMIHLKRTAKIAEQLQQILGQ